MCCPEWKVEADQGDSASAWTAHCLDAEWGLSCQHRCRCGCVGVRVGGLRGRWWRWDMALRLTFRIDLSLSALGGVVSLPGGYLILFAVKPT